MRLDSQAARCHQRGRAAASTWLQAIRDQGGRCCHHTCCRQPVHKGGIAMRWSIPVQKAAARIACRKQMPLRDDGAACFQPRRGLSDLGVMLLRPVQIRSPVGARQQRSYSGTSGQNGRSLGEREVCHRARSVWRAGERGQAENVFAEEASFFGAAWLSVWPRMA